MHLVSCNACEKPISPNAAVCPHCGQPLPVGKTGRLIKPTAAQITGAVFVLVAGGVFWYLAATGAL